MKKLTIRVSDTEHEHLSRFCSLTERSQNDVLRHCIRLLSVPGTLKPIDNFAISPDTVLGSHPDAHPDG